MDIISGKIETFVVLGIIDSPDLANRITAAFEDLGIPVLLEHLESADDSGHSAFRISTQTQFSENASRIVDNFTTAHDTKKIVTSKKMINRDTINN